MKCMYCQEWCTLIPGSKYSSEGLPNRNNLHWNCKKCSVYFWADSHVYTRIKFIMRQDPKTYYLELYPQHKRTHLHYTEPYPAKWTFGGAEPDIQATLVDLPYLMDGITPQNLKEKINYLLTFS